MQQREERIIRQGNENPKVEIYTYVTENTFNAYLYQLVESKQKRSGSVSACVLQIKGLLCFRTEPFFIFFI